MKHTTRTAPPWTANLTLKLLLVKPSGHFLNHSLMKLKLLLISKIWYEGFRIHWPSDDTTEIRKLKRIWDWWNQFIGFVLWSSNNHHRWIGPTNCADALCIQFEACKLFILKDRLNYEYKQQSELTSMQQKLDHKI